MAIGMLLEMLGIGLIVPVIALLSHNDLITDYPYLQPILSNIDHYDRKYLVMAVMLILFAAYLIKNIFLAFLAWKQAKFTFELKAELSKRLFVLYLAQPYTFHLQHNSAKLIRNIQNEVNVFITSAINPVMTVSTETLVVAGICALLFIVEPIGIFVVVLIFGIASGIYYYTTKRLVVQRGHARQYHDGLSLQHLHQGLGAAKDVKILGREKDFIKKLVVILKKAQK